MRLFLAVAETGNFTRAAERVFLSQPALSHRIRVLEEDLGVSLFERTPRGAVLTQAGKTLLEDARHLLAYVEASVRRARRAGGVTDDTLRAGFDFAEFGSVPPMPSLLGAFRERFPEAEVDIQTLGANELEHALLNETLDIAFLLGPPRDEGLGFHPLLVGAYFALMPTAHLLAAEAEVTPSALRAERLRLPKLNEHNEKALLAWLEPGEGAPRVTYRSAEVSALAGLVAAGEGVAVLPSGLLENRVSPSATVRPLARPAPRWTFGLAWRKEKPPFFGELGQRIIREQVLQPVEV